MWLTSLRLQSSAGHSLCLSAEKPTGGTLGLGPCGRGRGVVRDSVPAAPMTGNPVLPADALDLLRCPVEGGLLAVCPPSGANRLGADGCVSCSTCGRSYPIAGGVLSLLADPPAHPELARELRIRDERAQSILAGTRPEWQSAFADATEMPPMFAALKPLRGATILELGCGTGRYTLPLARRAKCVVAVDFSIRSLAVLREKLPPGSRVALVQADVSALRVAPGAFNRVVSTLHSNLPTREHRLACCRLAASALDDDGRFVFGTHYHGLRDILLRIPRSGHYPETGIYRYRMRPGEVRREARTCFERVRVRPTQVRLPGLRNAAAARAAARLPVLGSFGELLLAVAERPVRPARSRS